MEILGLENIMGEIKKFNRWVDQFNIYRDIDRKIRGEVEFMCVCVRACGTYVCLYMNVYYWV